MEQKTLLGYYKMVAFRAFHKAWDKFGAWGTLLTIIAGIVVAVITYLSKDPKIRGDFGRNDVIMATEITFILFIIGMILFIFREPVIIHNEQAADKDKLQSENCALEESAKPKLELMFQANVPPFNERVSEHRPRGLGNGNDSVFLRVALCNTSSHTPIGNIVVQLAEILSGQPINRLPAELSIMNDQDKHLTVGAKLFINVIEVIEEKSNSGEVDYELNFCFSNQELQPKQKPFLSRSETYEFIIRASGDNSPPKEKTFVFEFSETNGKANYKIREVNDGQEITQPRQETA